MSQATSRSRRPTNGTSLTSRSNIRSVIAQARRNVSSSPSSLTARSCSTSPFRGTSSTPASRSCSANDHGRTFASKPIRPERFSPSQPISDRFVCTASTPSIARADSM